MGHFFTSGTPLKSSRFIARRAYYVTSFGSESSPMDSAETLRLSSILSILGGSLELSIALPETFTPPIRPDAPILTLFGLIMIVCGAMLYSTTKLQVLWGATAIAMALLVIVVGSPVEGL